MDFNIWEDRITVARKRPRMYMMSDHLNQLNAESAYLNFFHAVLDEGTHGAPTAIELITSGVHHFAVAYGCTAPVDFPAHENTTTPPKRTLSLDLVQFQPRRTPSTVTPY